MIPAAATTAPDASPAGAHADATEPALPPEETAPSRPAGLQRGAVHRVIDGDTIDVTTADGVIRIRLIGIDTPERVDPNSPEECFGREATARAAALLDGEVVYLQADPSQGDRDGYGRYLRYVWLEDGRMFNFEMVAEGYAIEYTYNVPYRYQDAFRAAQRYAAETFLGLWALDACAGNADLPVEQVPPPPLPARPTPPSSSGNCHPSYPTVCIPPSPPDLDCGDIPFRRFQVIGSDPHRFDGDHDGIGCEG